MTKPPKQVRHYAAKTDRPAKTPATVYGAGVAAKIAAAKAAAAAKRKRTQADPPAASHEPSPPTKGDNQP